MRLSGGEGLLGGIDEDADVDVDVEVDVDFEDGGADLFFWFASQSRCSRMRVFVLVTTFPITWT